MAQHDYDIINQTSSALRSDLNNALAAIVSQNSGDTEPATPFASQFWYDTLTNYLKQRDESNSTWITLGFVNESAGKFEPNQTFATQAEAEAFTNNLVAMTPLRTSQAIDLKIATQAQILPENRIINGGFDFWQRGTTSSVVGFGAADRWRQSGSGGTFTQTRQAFAAGTTFGSNNPTYYLRQSVSGQTLTTSQSQTGQYIEDVHSYAGQTITVLGWAKRFSGSGNMAVEGVQYFGTGGSPSADVTAISPTTVTLTDSWTPFAVTLTIPSITGKTIGTNLDSFFALTFWTSAGSTFNARTNSLGLQTIAVDFWGIHIRSGTHTTAAVSSYRQPEIGPELVRCQRFYNTGSVYGWGYAPSASLATRISTVYFQKMRSAPSITLLNAAYTNSSGAVAGSINSDNIGVSVTSTAIGTIRLTCDFTADAEL